MRKRFLSTLLVLCMVLAMVPIETFAAQNAEYAEPQVTHLTVSYEGGETVELLGTQPTISMPVGSKPVFTVTFDNTDLLNKVFVTSTKDGETKYLEAKPQGIKYVTDGYFDPSDIDYIPGTIAVTYTKRAVTVTDSNTVNGINLSAMKQQLEAQGVSVQGGITSTDDGSINAKIVLGEYFGGMGDVVVDASISELTSSAGIDDKEVQKWVGVYNKLATYDLEGANGKDYILYFTDKDWSDADTYVMLVKDVSGNKYTKMVLQKAGLKDIAENLPHVNTVAKTYLEYVAISDEMDDLREEVNAHPTMTSAQKAEANQKINDLENDKKLFMMGMTFIPMFFGTAGVATPLFISALLAGYSSTADYFWDYRVGMIQGCAPIENSFSDENGENGGIALTQAYIGSTEKLLSW